MGTNVTLRGGVIVVIVGSPYFAFLADSTGKGAAVGLGLSFEITNGNMRDVMGSFIGGIRKAGT
jgi:hypothetical protein